MQTAENYTLIPGPSFLRTPLLYGYATPSRAGLRIEVSQRSSVRNRIVIVHVRDLRDRLPRVTEPVHGSCYADGDGDDSAASVS